MTAPELIPGAIYRVGAACGVPHGFRPIRFRLAHVDEVVGAGSHLVGYELDDRDHAVDHRTIYVITAGLRLESMPAAAALPRRRPTNAGPARIPQPRKSPEPTTRNGRTR
jgi:hypothetical protein